MTSVIVLNSRGYFWRETTDIHRILNLVDKKKVEVLKYDENCVFRSAGDFGKEGTVKEINAPLVVRLSEFPGYKIKEETVDYSSYAVYERDGNICQYEHCFILNEDGDFVPCEPFKYRCTEDERTLDHIIPVSRGGKSSFLNCVCCCRIHNELIKKDLTPKEAGLKLIRQPYIPTRKVGEYYFPKFTFNPKKQSHKAFYEVMGLTFNHKV
jgi:5-methylcytosine-specific restriction endonuclease McrA